MRTPFTANRLLDLQFVLITSSLIINISTKETYLTIKMFKTCMILASLVGGNKKNFNNH